MQHHVQRQLRSVSCWKLLRESLTFHSRCLFYRPILSIWLYIPFSMCCWVLLPQRYDSNPMPRQQLLLSQQHGSDTMRCMLCRNVSKCQLQCVREYRLSGLRVWDILPLQHHLSKPMRSRKCLYHSSNTGTMLSIILLPTANHPCRSMRRWIVLQQHFVADSMPEFILLSCWIHQPVTVSAGILMHYSIR